MLVHAAVTPHANCMLAIHVATEVSIANLDKATVLTLTAPEEAESLVQSRLNRTKLVCLFMLPDFRWILPGAEVTTMLKSASLILLAQKSSLKATRWA